ncbi:fatty acyl-AMP ligase [Rhodobacter capsulatus]|uniref:fatty acyl-AMP ligase n=1 Tax=Rhodobacter capsulatus TaxID=1061 RepID=UPI0003D2E55F|nr:fatty acyl-AMP ligase [Rhodobacter capsulatus]ETD83926.1 AMP-dependent synthetase and ligase [Rhodobacter capsulatus B6]
MTEGTSPGLPGTRPDATLAQVLQRHARNCPDKIALRFLDRGEGEGTCLTYAGLDRQARLWAAELLARGARGQTVLLVYPPGLPFVIGFWACLYAGAIAVPTPFITPARSAPRIAAIAADARPRLVLCSAALAAEATIRDAVAALRPDLDWIATDGPAPAGDPPQPEPPHPEDPAFLQYTSGSTADPRGVIVTQSNLIANMEMIRRAFGHDSATRMVSWLPLFHDMGLVGGMLQPLYLGAETVLMAPMDFIQRPLRWLQAIARHRATSSGGPNFAYALCAERLRPEQIEGLDLSSWRVAFCGAEPVRAGDLRRFAARLAPAGFDPKALFPCYGMAETTLFVSGGPAGSGLATLPGPADQPERVICGLGAAGQQLAIVDPETRERLPEGRVGEIWVAGPHVGAGYWQQPDRSRDSFGARIANEDGPAFLRTGDLGQMRGGGLAVVGRLKDIVIIRGAKHHPEDIEAAATCAHPALSATAAAFAVPQDGTEALVVVQEVRRGHQADPALDLAAQAVTAAICEGFGVRPLEVVLVRPGTLPRTTSNKIRRGACRAAHLAGELARCPVTKTDHLSFSGGSDG